MSDETPQPYFSDRVHISELSTKAFAGVINRSIETTFGNQNERIVVRNEQDIADIKTESIQNHIWDLWDAVTKEGKARGKKFIEDVEEE